MKINIIKYRSITLIVIITTAFFNSSCTDKDKDEMSKVESNLIAFKNHKDLPTDYQIVSSILTELNLTDADFKQIDATGGSFNESSDLYEVNKGNINFKLSLEGKSVEIDKENSIHEIKVQELTLIYPDGKKFNCVYRKN